VVLQWCCSAVVVHWCHSGFTVVLQLCESGEQEVGGRASVSRYRTTHPHTHTHTHRCMTSSWEKSE
jgi:hypothetical protein